MNESIERRRRRRPTERANDRTRERPNARTSASRTRGRTLSRLSTRRPASRCVVVLARASRPSRRPVSPRPRDVAPSTRRVDNAIGIEKREGTRDGSSLVDSMESTRPRSRGRGTRPSTSHEGRGREEAVSGVDKSRRSVDPKVLGGIDACCITYVRRGGWMRVNRDGAKAEEMTLTWTPRDR